MKKLPILTYLFVLLMAAFVQSCDDMTDNYYDYVKDGGIHYLPKADSVVSYPGKNRVLIRCLLTNAYNVNKIWVYWNAGKDSTSFDYKQAAHVDTVNLMITNLEEKSYIFDIYTKNQDGNRSIKVTTFSTAYGERYRQSLYPRVPTGFSCDTLNGTMSWLASDESELNTEIAYTNIHNNLTSTTLSTDTSKVKLAEFSDSGPVTYRSFYKPEPTCIDVFETDWATFTLPAGYSIFKTIAMAPRTGGATVTWDNPQNVPISVRVQYLSNTGVLTTKIFKTSPAVITGLNTTPRDFKVMVIESSGNTFGPKVFRITPL